MTVAIFKSSIEFFQKEISRYSLCFSLHLTNTKSDDWLIYFVYFSIIPFLISAAIIFLYALILKKIKQESAYFLKEEFSRRYFLLLFKASLIISSNFLTWTPIVICGFLAAINKSFLTQRTYNWIFIIILPLNSILNVFIQSNFNIKFFALKRKRKMLSILKIIFSKHLKLIVIKIQ